MENKTIQSLNDRRVRKQNQIACLNDLENKIKGVELGADDFIVKPIVSRELRARIKCFIRLNEMGKTSSVSVISKRKYG